MSDCMLQDGLKYYILTNKLLIDTSRSFFNGPFYLQMDEENEKDD